MIRSFRSAFVCLAVCLSARAGSAKALRLFELEIQDAGKADLFAAVTKAGGIRKEAKNPNIATFDVDAIGIPEMRTLEVVYHEERFVLAAYHSEERGDMKADERLRKMLVEKYGPPKGLSAAAFTVQYLPDGRYAWDFDKGMKLVFKKDFFGSVDLTYVDEGRFDRVKSLAEAADQNAARNEARRKASAF